MLYSKIEGQGKPLMILHGFFGMSDNWKTLGTRFAEAGYEVHMLDLRNHGRSLHSDVFTYDAMVGDLVEYCDGHSLKQLDIIGHSMGGKLAMFFASKYPERINKLIVADIAPKYYPPHHSEILSALNAVDFSKKPSRSDVDAMMEKGVSDFGTRQFLLKSLYWKEPGQLAFRFNLEVFNEQIENIGEALPDNAHFEKPTLFLKGEHSRYIKPEDHQNIREQFPDSEIVTINGAGHWLHAENPDDFYDAVIRFLK